MSKRALVAAVVGWVTVVGATSAVAWVAIDRAGREVLTAPAGSIADPGVVATGAPRTPSGRSTTSRPTPTSRPTEHPSPTAPSTSGSSTTTHPHPAATQTPSTTRTRTTVASAPSAVDRTVRVEGGQLGVRCTGSTASLRFAQPADGWSVKVEEAGPDKVKVQFTGSAQHREIEVEARCSGGTPVFSTSDDEHSSDGTSRNTSE